MHKLHKNVNVYLTRPPNIKRVAQCIYVYLYLYTFPAIMHDVYMCRWTINLALETFSKIVCVKSAIDSEDMHKVILQSVYDTCVQNVYM